MAILWAGRDGRMAASDRTKGYELSFMDSLVGPVSGWAEGVRDRYRTSRYDYPPTHRERRSGRRKMCAVIPRHLGKGAAARPRCIPQAMALPRHPASSDPSKRRHLTTLRERSFRLIREPYHDHRSCRWGATRSIPAPWTLHNGFSHGDDHAHDFALPWTPSSQERIFSPKQTHRTTGAPIGYGQASRCWCLFEVSGHYPS
ncbi:hypothetical protein GGE65_005448 [Skermanella aerolata]